MVDWGLAAKIAGGGLATAFITLLSLAAAIWIIGLLIKRAANKNKITTSGSVGDSEKQEV